MTGEIVPKDYTEILEDLKSRIHTSRIKAALSSNRELIQLYWEIGKIILDRQKKERWGKAVVERLSNDIKKEFPGIKGFSPQNIWRMRSFCLAYTEDLAKLSQAVRENKSSRLISQIVRESEKGNPPYPVTEIPWGHNIVLVEKLKNPFERLWYAQQTIKNGWSRAVLELQIENYLYKRQGQAISNFKTTLLPPQSDLAKNVLKDPYVFDFLSLRDDYNERILEEGLIEHIQRFLIELGAGFAFAGRQVHLEIGGEDFYIDLLFYHLKLRCYIVIDLKVKEFTPEYAGKMNFYLSAVDDLLRHPDDKPSIGLILCKSKKRIITEYALRDLNKPVGVSSYVTKLVETLPKEYKGTLPSPEEIEKELSKIDWEEKEKKGLGNG